MKDLINWHELSRRLSGNGQNIRPNKIPKKYETKVNRLLKILEVWDRWVIGYANDKKKYNDYRNRF